MKMKSFTTCLLTLVCSVFISGCQKEPEQKHAEEIVTTEQGSPDTNIASEPSLVAPMEEATPDIIGPSDAVQEPAPAVNEEVSEATESAFVQNFPSPDKVEVRKTPVEAPEPEVRDEDIDSKNPVPVPSESEPVQKNESESTEPDPDSKKDSSLLKVTLSRGNFRNGAAVKVWINGTQPPGAAARQPQPKRRNNYQEKNPVYPEENKFEGKGDGPGIYPFDEEGKVTLELEPKFYYFVLIDKNQTPLKIRPWNFGGLLKTARTREFTYEY
jgi:hypothetical protein